MKNSILKTIAIGVVCANSAFAAINVDWSTQSGFTMSDGITPIFGAPGSSALIQLLFTTDSGYVMPASITVAEILTPVNATILDSATFDETVVGNSYGANFSDTYSGSFSSGFLFVRVFSDPSPTVGSFFFQGSVANGGLFATVDNPGAPTPNDSVSEGTVGGGSGNFGTYTLTGVVVPEPSVLAFLGLGGLALAARRRFIA